MGFLQDFMGTSARGDIRRGQQTGLADIDTGTQGALDSFNRGIGRLDPYVQGGQQGYDAYLASLGLRGDAERSRVQGMYFNDPIQNALMDRTSRSLSRRLGSQGMGNSGAAYQAYTNALLDRYGGFQDRLRGLGEGGAGVAGAQANIDTNAGNTQFAAGQQRAAVNMGAANAMAASRSTGINNLLNVAGTVARFVNPAGNISFGGGGGTNRNSPGGTYPYL